MTWLRDHLQQQTKLKATHTQKCTKPGFELSRLCDSFVE